MSEKTKNIIIGVLIIGLVTMTVAYAALSQTLTINGSAKVAAKSSSWNVHFVAEDGATEPIVLNGYAALTTANSTITLTNTTVTAPDVTLKAPGDKASFYFDVINEGAVNAKIGSLPSNLAATTGIVTGYTVAYADNSTADSALNNFKSAIEVKLKYVDSAIAANDPLYGTSSSSTPKRRDLLLTIEFKDTGPNQTMLDKAITISGITTTLTYVQN